VEVIELPNEPFINVLHGFPDPPQEGAAFLELSCLLKALLSHHSKKLLTVSKRMMQPTALRPIGCCHINSTTLPRMKN